MIQITRKQVVTKALKANSGTRDWLGEKAVSEFSGEGGGNLIPVDGELSKRGEKLIDGNGDGPTTVGPGEGVIGVLTSKWES